MDHTSLLGARGSNKQNARSFEFTPIGKSTRNNDRNIGEDKENHRFMAVNSQNLDRLSNGVHYDTVEDSEEFSTFAGSPFPASRSVRVPAYSSTNEVPVKTSNLLTNGGIAITEQQNMNHELNKDNHDMKIEIRYLRDQLQLIPTDITEAMYEKSVLQKQLNSADEEIVSLRKHVVSLEREVESLSSQTGEREAAALSIQKLQSEYDALLREKDHEYNGLLREKEHKYEAVLEEKDHEISEYRHRLDGFENGNDIMSTENEQLRLQIRTSVKENDDLRQHNQELVRENDSINDKYDALLREFDSNEKLIRDLQSSNDNLNEKLAAIDSEFKLKKNEVGKLEDWVEELKSENRQLRDRCDSFNEELGRANIGNDHELSDAKQRIRELESLNRRINDKLEKKRSDLDEALNANKSNDNDLLRRLNGLEREINDHQRLEADLRAQIDSYEAQLNSRDTNDAELNKRLTAQIASLKDEVFHLTSSSGNSISQTNSLQRQNRELMDEVSRLQDEVVGVQEQKKVSDKKFRSLEGDFDRLAEDYQALKEEREKLIQQVRNQSKVPDSGLTDLEKYEFERLKATHEVLEKETKALQNSIDELKNELNKERNETDELQFENNRLRKELESSTDNEQIERLLNENRGYYDKQLRKERDYYEERLREARDSQSNRFAQDFRPSSTSETLELDQKCRRLSMEKDHLETELMRMENKCSDLQRSVVSKEDMLDKMELELKEMKRRNKYSMSFDEEEKAQLMKANDSKVKQLEIEIDNLQIDHESRIQYYKKKIEDITKTMEKSTEGASEAIVALLEIQLKYAKETQIELEQQVKEEQTSLKSVKAETTQLHDAISIYQKNEELMEQEIAYFKTESKSKAEENKALENKCEDLTKKLEHKTAIIKKLEDQLDQIQSSKAQLKTESEKNEVSYLQEVISNHEQDERLLQLQILDLKAMIESKSANFEAALQLPYELRSKLEEKEVTINGLVIKLDLAERSALNHSPADYDKLLQVFYNNVEVIRDYQREKELLDIERKYYQLKEHIWTLKAKDFESMYKFVLKQRKAVGVADDIEQSTVALSKLAIDLDYKSYKPKKLTFSMVAKMVLAMVKMKRRGAAGRRSDDAVVKIEREIKRQRALQQFCEKGI